MKLPREIMLEVQRSMMRLRRGLEAECEHQGILYDTDDENFRAALMKTVYIFLFADMDNLFITEAAATKASHTGPLEKERVEEGGDIEEVEEVEEAQARRPRRRGIIVDPEESETFLERVEVEAGEEEEEVGIEEDEVEQPPHYLLGIALPPPGMDARFTAEFPVNPLLAPFLISAAKRDLLWVKKVKGNTVRTGVREKTPEEAFTAVLKEVALVGQKMGFGNVQPLNIGGVRKAAEYVRSFGIPDLELLLSSDVDPEMVRPLGISMVRADWMPTKTVVVVPSDRQYLGFFMPFADGRLAVLVHNAIRGMALAVGWPTKSSKNRIEDSRKVVTPSRSKKRSKGIAGMKIPYVPPEES